MARDSYNTPWENIRSLILAIDAIRSIERHGGSTMMERAFAGFAAIAPPSWKRPWRIPCYGEQRFGGCEMGAALICITAAMMTLNYLRVPSAS